MSNWIATNELRFVDRILKWESGEGDTRIPLQTIRILQQKWECHVKEDDYLRTLKIEWRDVPVVEKE